MNVKPRGSPSSPGASAGRRPFAGPWVHELAGTLARVVIAGAHREGLTDLRPAHLPVLRSMRPSALRIGEIAHRAGIAKASLVYLVNDLERLGYVVRAQDPSDARATLVKLTDKGTAMQDAARRAVSELQDHWEKTVTPEDIERFSDTLVRLVQLSETWMPSNSPAVAARHRGRRRADQ